MARPPTMARPSTTRGPMAIVLDMSSGDESDEGSDLEGEMEQRVNPLHLIPALSTLSRGAKKFDFNNQNNKDDDWLSAYSVADDHKIALS